GLKGRHLQVHVAPSALIQVATNSHGLTAVAIQCCPSGAGASHGTLLVPLPSYNVASMFQVDTQQPTPLYHQPARSIRFAIAKGRLGIGDQLPTVRQLAVDLRNNANT